MHIELDDELVREVDRLAGPRERSGFVRRAVAQAVEDARRAESLLGAAGALKDGEDSHDWDEDPARWVRTGRRGDARRAG
jgi:predicted transcriptional regulator